METSDGGDMQLGLGLALGLLGVLGAAVMFGAGMAGDQLLAGWGFAAAMVAGSLAVAAIHLYP